MTPLLLVSLLLLVSPAPPEPPSSVRVDTVAPEWWTCHDAPRFRLEALRNPRGYERGTGALSRALRHFIRHDLDQIEGQPARGWRFLSRRGPRAAVFAGRRPEYHLMRFEKRRGRWRWSGSGGCAPRAWRDGHEAVPWKVSAAPRAEDTEVPVLVSERSCSSGRDATGRILDPWVHYGPERITVTFHVRPVDGFSTCQSSPDTPYVLELEEPVGGRAIVDGGVPPRGAM